MGIALKFSTAYHLQIDGQTEVVNQRFEDLLQCLVGEHLSTWDTVLHLAKFAYNNSINRSTGLSPFEIVTCSEPRKPINLLSLPISNRPSASSESFAHDLHNKIRQQIAVSNDN